MASTWKNRVKFRAGSSGTGNFSIGAAVDSSFQTPAGAGYTNGQTGSYVAISDDHSQIEWGHFTYSTTGPTWQRTTVLNNGGAAVNFTAAPVITVDILAEDFTAKLDSTAGDMAAISGLADTAVASAATCNIGAAATDDIHITGTTTITAFDNVTAGTVRRGYFSGALTLTHNATSLKLPGNANITTAANDRFEAMSLGSGNWIVLWYTNADGTPIVAPAGGGMTLLGTLATTSGASVTLTGIAAGYHRLYLEFEGVSGNNSSTTLQLAISVGGATFGTAVSCSSTGTASEFFNGTVAVQSWNINSSNQSARAMNPYMNGSTVGNFSTLGQLAAEAAGQPTAVRILVSNGAFDAGTIRVYGEK